MIIYHFAIAYLAAFISQDFPRLKCMLLRINHRWIKMNAGYYAITTHSFQLLWYTTWSCPVAFTYVNLMNKLSCTRQAVINQRWEKTLNATNSRKLMKIQSTRVYTQDVQTRNYLVNETILCKKNLRLCSKTVRTVHKTGYRTCTLRNFYSEIASERTIESRIF